MIQKKKFLVYGLLFALALTVIPGQVMMVRGESYENTTSVSLPYEIGDIHFNRFAVVSGYNTLSQLWVEGENPAKITQVDWTNTSFSGYPQTIEDERQYPYYLGQSSYLTTGIVPYPWSQVDWFFVQNSTEPGTGASNYNFTLSREVIGNIATGESLDVYIPFPDEYQVTLDLSVQNEGWTVVYYDHNDVVGFSDIINPAGQIISAQVGVLPDANPGGDPIRKYISFFAGEAGLYQLVFTPNSHYLSFSMDTFRVTSTLDPGTQVSYKNRASTDINPQTLQGDSEMHPIQVYKMALEAGQYLQYSWDFIWGSASDTTMRIVFEHNGEYLLYTPVTDGNYHYLLKAMSGDVYFVLMHDDYFSWDGATPVQSVISYDLFVNAITPQAYTLGDDLLINIPASEEFTAVTFSTNETKLVGFNTTTVAGSPMNYFSSSPNSAITMLNTKYGSHTVPAFDTYEGMSIYELLPGSYVSPFYHSGTGLNNELVTLTSDIFKVNPEINSIAKYSDEWLASQENGTYAINYEDKSVVSTQMWNPAHPDGSIFVPVVIPINITDPLNNYVNISVTRADNPSISDNRLRFHLGGGFYVTSPYDGTYLIESTSLNPSIIDLQSGDQESNVLTETLTLTSTSAFLGQYNVTLWLWPTEVEINDGIDWLNYNGTVKLRVAMVDQNLNYRSISGVSIDAYEPKDPTTINYEIQEYGYLGHYNDSQVQGFIFPVDTNRTFDWWQFIVHTNMSGTGELSIFFLSENSWTSTNILPGYNLVPLFTAENEPDYLFELGLAVKAFKLLVTISDPTSDKISLEVKISRMNCTILYSPEGTSEFVKGVPTWVLPTGIGGGVAIIAIVGGVIYYKKKHPI